MPTNNITPHSYEPCPVCGRARRFHIDLRAAKLADEIEAGGDPDQLLSDQQLSELAGISVAWFQNARAQGYAPPFIRLSPRRIRTKRSDYVAWLRERTFLRTSDYYPPDGSRGRKPGTKVIGGKAVLPVVEADDVGN